MKIATVRVPKDKVGDMQKVFDNARDMLYQAEASAFESDQDKANHLWWVVAQCWRIRLSAVFHAACDVQFDPRLAYFR